MNRLFYLMLFSSILLFSACVKKEDSKLSSFNFTLYQQSDTIESTQAQAQPNSIDPFMFAQTEIRGTVLTHVKFFQSEITEGLNKGKYEKNLLINVYGDTIGNYTHGEPDYLEIEYSNISSGFTYGVDPRIINTSASLTISEFGAVDGRIKGSFSASLCKNIDSYIAQVIQSGSNMDCPDIDLFTLSGDFDVKRVAEDLGQ